MNVETRPVLGLALSRPPVAEAASVQLRPVQTGLENGNAAALSCALRETTERKTGSHAYANEGKPGLLAALSGFPAAASVRSNDVWEWGRHLGNPAPLLLL